MLSCSSDCPVNISMHRTYTCARTNDNSCACKYVTENRLHISPYRQRRKHRTMQGSQGTIWSYMYVCEPAYVQNKEQNPSKHSLHYCGYWDLQGGGDENADGKMLKWYMFIMIQLIDWKSVPDNLVGQLGATMCTVLCFWCCWQIHDFEPINKNP